MRALGSNPFARERTACHPPLSVLRRDCCRRRRAGTPFFAAPEIFERRPYGLKADVFSLGVTLYTLVAGIPPLSRVHDTVVRIRRGKTPGMPGSVSQGLRSFIHTLMTVDPAQRPTAEAARSLPWLLQGAPPPPPLPAAGSSAAATEAAAAAAVAQPLLLPAVKAAAAPVAAAGGSSRGRVSATASAWPPPIAEEGGAPPGAAVAISSPQPPDTSPAAAAAAAAPQSFVDAARMSHAAHTYERACATLLALLLTPQQCDALVARCRALALARAPSSNDPADDAASDASSFTLEDSVLSARELEAELRALSCGEAAAQLTALRARVAASVEGADALDHEILGASLATLADLPLAHARHVHVQESLLRGDPGARGGAPGGAGAAAGGGRPGGGGGGSSAARAHRENLLLLERGLQLQQLWARRHLGPNNTFHGGGAGGPLGSSPPGSLRVGSASAGLHLLAAGGSSGRGRSSARGGGGWGAASTSPAGGGVQVVVPQQHQQQAAAPPLLAPPQASAPPPALLFGGATQALRRWASFDVGFFDQQPSPIAGLAVAGAAAAFQGASHHESSVGGASVFSSMDSIDEMAPLGSPPSSPGSSAASSTAAFAQLSSSAPGASSSGQSAVGAVEAAPPPPPLTPTRAMKAASFTVAPRVAFPQSRGLVVVGPGGVHVPPPAQGNIPNAGGRWGTEGGGAQQLLPAGGSARTVRWAGPGAGSSRSDVRQRSSLEAAILLEEALDEGLLAAATPPLGAGGQLVTTPPAAAATRQQQHDDSGGGAAATGEAGAAATTHEQQEEQQHEQKSQTTKAATAAAAQRQQSTKKKGWWRR